MKLSNKIALWVFVSMMINMALGFVGLFAYWGWPDFPAWTVDERRGWLFIIETIPALFAGIAKWIAYENRID